MNLAHNKIHCLVIPFPTQGHINPMLQFSKRLQHKGIEITLVPTIYIFNKSMQELTSSITIEPISDGYDDVNGLFCAKSIETYLESHQIVGSQALIQLIEKLKNKGNPINCVIYDSFMPWILDVAKMFGLLPVEGHDQVLLPGLLQPLVPSDLPSFVNDMGSYPPFLKMLVDQFSNIQEADWILCNTIYELEKHEVDWITKRLRLRTIGPTIPSMYVDKRLENDNSYGLSIYKPKSDVCMKWLSDCDDGSVVYVSFGSMAELKEEQMKEIACGLNKSNHNFLWVVRESEEPKIPKDFLDNIKREKGLVVTWCPQLDVLSHKAIGCFMTHCGWNSTLEALSLGVPTVAIPIWTDQCTNAKYVMDIWEMGIKAQANEKGVVEQEVVEHCIREVMEGERGKEIRKNATKWREVTKKAMDEGGSSDRNINDFVDKLVNES
ncbi:UDP-glycosyltransferase 74F2-like isoform X2 [Solanum lycopersicum]|uniref:UDP-glycosyltransferase 74F2-like isoform X2 n=1 Tax=Solanum lycopersicum TaxID=4081 RepID=UPI003749A4E6